MEQPQVHRRALGKLVKVLLGGGGVAVGLPAPAAGKALAPVADEAHHILQRIAQKYPKKALAHPFGTQKRDCRTALCSSPCGVIRG